MAANWSAVVPPKRHMLEVCPPDYASLDESDAALPTVRIYTWPRCLAVPFRSSN
jgi:hypothetical protein